AVHLALAAWLDVALVYATSFYTILILWIGLMLLSYWVPKVWQAWGLILAIILASVGAILLG
ncbi:MAG: hypothetical protein AAF804_19600, partial [Bacteroidota bacterium]